MPTYTLNNVNYSYVVDSGIASVARSASASGNVIILDKFTVSGVEYTVTSMVNYAFQSCSNITSVIIPATITSIGNQVFELCTSLASLTIPSTVTSIGNNIINACTLLLQIIIKSNLANIKNALGNFNRVGLSLTLDFPGAILDGMCYNASNISTVIIGPNITSIGAEAFRFCNSLTSITIPSSVTSIGANAFNGTSSLINVYFLGNIPTIGASNFTASSDTAYYIAGATNTSSLTVFTSSNSVTSSQMYTLLGYVYPAPVITSINSGNNRAYINFTQSPPSSGQAPAIKNYAYSTDGTNYIDFSPTQITSPLKITGLNNDQIYSFTIKAYNDFYSSASNSVSILISSPQYYPGDLDTTFGINGKVSNDFATRPDVAYSVIVQPDNKIILGGYMSDQYSQNFAVIRYNRNGSLDTTFGNNGKFSLDTFGKYDNIRAVRLQSNGKIILGGWAHRFDNNKTGFALIRLNTNGTLDTTFGTDGKVFIDITNGYAYSMKIQSDDKIILGGYSWNTLNSDFTLVRINADGSIDTTFGNQGIVLTDLLSSGDDAIAAIEILSNGKILATGSSLKLGGYDFDIVLVRYNTDGSIDNTFGTNGIVRTTRPENNRGTAIAVDLNNKIYICGANNFLLARYNSDGSLDNTFGTNGMSTVAFGSVSSCNSVLILENGKIMLGGYVRTAVSSLTDDAVLICFNSDGTLDNTFGNNGIIITDFYNNPDGFESLALQKIGADSYIIAAGYASGPTGGSNFALARYFSTSALRYPVCFPSGTPIETDQGQIVIEKINSNIHTINNKKIIAVTKTITDENKIVCIEKDALGKQIPSQKTYISRNHEILYNDKMIKAKHLVKNVENVYFKEYNGETLYNILLDKHDTMVVNNLIVETLHPDNIVAQLYNSNLSENDKNAIIISINKFANNFKKFKGKMF